MALNYTYTKYKDVHTLKNDETFSVNYKVKRVECDTTVVLTEGTITASQTITLNFSLDGTYSIELFTDTEIEIVPDIIITKNLRNSIIELSEKVFCGCSKCNDCEECNNCEDYLQVLVKSIALNQMLYPKYEDSIQSLMTTNSCLFSEAVLLCLKDDKVFGNSDVKDILLQIISYYYLSFYSIDLSEATDNSEEEYITTTYKFSKISKCIKRLGVLETPIVSPSIYNQIFT
jgi:hypothetical protein